MRKILIATPVKGGLSEEYVAQLLSLFIAKVPEIQLDWLPCTGTSVALARNELAFAALQRNCDTLVFQDKDLFERSPQLYVNLFCRLISHKEPIVAVQYCGHGLPSQFHGCKYDEAAQPNENGLLKMFQMPIGFCKIEVEALKTIMRNTPQLAYWNKELKGEAEHRHQFFPTQIVGPNTAEGKLERIRKEWNSGKYLCGDAFEGKLDEILNDGDYSANTMYGEDYYFCKLAREAGLELYLDTTAIIPHQTGIKLPMPAADLKAELAASWRVPEPQQPKTGALVQGT